MDDKESIMIIGTDKDRGKNTCRHKTSYREEIMTKCCAYVRVLVRAR